jgi:hypothetical protein
VSDDMVKFLASLLAIALIIGALLGLNAYNAHRPCSDFSNVSVRYVPLRCLNAR